ncbi:uncharacterized protein LOC135501340 [Lineus longissimus]|uniref:uncharacterized protein LOC135501340 n=1 Tax=Lineus longissimus TaxID=88925 RepID=UPI002B4C5D06
MEGCHILADGLALFLLTMALLFPKGHPGKAFLENTNKESKPTAAGDSENVWSHVEIAFALIGVGTIMLVGLLWCFCNRSRRCNRNRRSRSRERSVSVIHITNNTTSNCVLLERPPSYCDAMSTPECPPPPYPGFGLENTDIGRYHCQRTPPPAYHNMAFDSGSADVLSSSISAGTGMRRSGSFRYRDTAFHGDSEFRVETLIRTDTGSQVDQQEGRENQGFLDSDNNNNRQSETSTRTITVSNSSDQLVVPLQEASDTRQDLRAITPLDQDSDTSIGERRDENSSECNSLEEGQDKNDSNSSSFRERRNENGSDGEHEPMVALRDISLEDDSHNRESATSETGLLRE